MADFQFFLNTQGLRGRTGLKGDAGFAPIIAIGQNTLNTFTLLITTADGTFETPNLRGSIINNAGSGTFLRYDAETDSIYLSELPTASETEVGGVTIATDEELANAAGTGVVTADSMGVGIYGALKAGNNILLSLDNETGLVTINSVDTKYTLPVATTDILGGVKPDGKTITITEDGKISAVGSGQGTSNYEELTNKPSLYGTEIVGDKKLSDFVEFKAPLKETIAVDYEKDVVIVNGNKTDDGITLNTNWNPLFTDTSSASLPFNINGDVTLNGSEFTPDSGVEMPFKPGDIIGVPGDTGADIALGNIREDGQFIFTHLIRIDGLGVSSINKALMPVATKTNSSGTLKCTCDSTVTNELTTGQNFTDNIAYFQVRVENGKMIAVCLKSVGGVFSNGVKVTSTNSTTVANSEKLQRFSFGGVGSNVNPLNQFKLYRNTGLKLEECADQTAFDGLANMVNWAFPDDTNNISVQVDNDTIKISETGQLAATDKVVKNNELDNYIKAGQNVVITKNTTTNALTIAATVGNPFYKDLQGLPMFNSPLVQSTSIISNLSNISINGSYLNIDVYAKINPWTSSIPRGVGVEPAARKNAELNTGYIKPASYIAIPYQFGQIVTIDNGFGSAVALFAKYREEQDNWEILGYLATDASSFTTYMAGVTSVYAADTSKTWYYRGTYDSNSYLDKSISALPLGMTMFQMLVDNEKSTGTAFYKQTYESSGAAYRTVASDTAGLERLKQTTHVLITGFPTNTNTFKVSNFGLYASDGKTLGTDIFPAEVLSKVNLFDINESTETININCKVDGQTVVVDKNGNLSVGNDVMLKEQLYTQVVPGDNISITEDANTHKITISSTGGGGGGTVDAYTKAETDDLLATKQDTLISGINIKTINGESVLGEGNLVVSGGSGVEYADSNTIVNSTVGSTMLGPYTATSGILVDTNTGVATIPTSGTPQLSLDFTPVEFAGHTFDVQVAFKVRGNAPLSGLAVVWQEKASYSNRTAPQLFIQANGNLTFDIPNADGTGWLVGDAPTGVTVSGGDTVVARLICDGSKITSSVSKNGGDPVAATIYNGAYVRTGTVQFMYGETSTASSAFKETIEYVDLMNTYVKYDGEYIWQSTSSIKNALAVKISSDTNNALIAKTTGLFVEKVDVMAINDSIAQLMSRIAALEAEINGGNA